MNRQLAAEFSMEELQEFLEGDLGPDQADPVFKEELRRELWQMVQERHGRDGSDGSDGSDGEEQ